MTTYALKASEIVKEWYVIDAQDLVLGRLASVIAVYLRGKHKPIYSPHLDCGDNIVVINADKVHLTGRKLDKKFGKKYYWHTGYMGGIKETTAHNIIEGKFPERLLKNAVKRMLGKNKLGRKHLTNLYVYSSNEHKHEAQQPKNLDVAAINNKNSKR